MVASVRGLFSLFAVVVFGGVATATGCGGDNPGAGDYVVPIPGPGGESNEPV
jgi:hypothetical protein